MCQPPRTNIETRRVVIAGAGPAGLLFQALLHNRNKAIGARVMYDVTLVESRPDLGQLSTEELKAHRSWMIGLAGHGLEAVRSVPGLYDKYLAEVGISVTEVDLFLGAKKMSMGSGATGDQESFIVDRNFIVAALARYAKDNMNSQFYTSKYETEILYVDSENHRVLIRDKSTKEEEYLSYDLLVGADGVRSTVREALVKRHFDFELQVSDIFSTFKAVHIQRPEAMKNNSMSVLPGCLPSFNGICLPETGDLVCLSMGVPRNEFDSISSDIKSSDPKVVAQYFKENFKVCELSEESYTDLATQWVNQRWNRTGQVHCNRYSSTECKIVLMGDSAHATSPSIGMGMNTALRDAQKLNELLDKFEDDLDLTLPQYSIDRVPEGNALSDLALNLYCFDQKVGMRSMIVSGIRTGMHSLFPSLVAADPNTLIGLPNVTLSKVYQMASEMGSLKKHRAINQRIRHEFFEKEVGMVKEKPKLSLMKHALVVVPVAACAVSMFIQYQQ
ncbi:hypothetical protein ACHAXR_007291 [Thalassiosira sp. AJA248-18]